MQHKTFFAIILILMVCSMTLAGNGKRRKRYNALKEQVEEIEKKLAAINSTFHDRTAELKSHLGQMWDSCGCEEEPVCPEGWWQNNNECYFWVKELKAWKDAADHCHSLGGHLAIPDNQEEENFLGELTVSYNLHPWLGASDEDEEGVWRSEIDGHPLSYTNWLDSNALEPNGGRNENCLDFKIVDGHAYWNDAPCGVLLNAICEIALLKA